MQFLMRNKMIIGIGVVALIAFIYFGMGNSSGPTSLIKTTGVNDNGPDQGLIETLIALRAVKLDGTIFGETAFTGLQDFSTQIIPEPIGRSNPFAPLISAIEAVSGTSTHGSDIFQPKQGSPGTQTTKTPKK